MSAVLEQYFQTVVVDKLDNMITKQFQEMKDDLNVLKKLQSDYTNLSIEIESLKKRVTDPSDDIKETSLPKNGKTIVAQKPVSNKAVIKKPAAKKAVAKKPAVKKKVATKKKANK